MSMRNNWGYCHACCCSGETNLDTECDNDRERLYHEAQFYLNMQGYAQEQELSSLLADFAMFVEKNNKIDREIEEPSNLFNLLDK